MDLEELNNEYLKLKADLEKANNDKKALETKLNDLVDDRTVQQGKIIEAKRNKDNLAKQNAENEIKKIDASIKKIMEDAKKKLNEATAIKAKIDKRIEKIQNNPEMKKHLSDVLAKKYDRKLSKLEKEKEELEGRKGRLDNLKTLVANHPALGNNLKGILVATKEINGLQEELDSMATTTAPGVVTYSNPARANDIINNLMPAAQTKLAANKNPLIAYITKNSLEIKEEDIDELSETTFVLDGKGNLDLNATMDRRTSKLNRQIKGLDKSISDNKVALAKHGKVHTPKTSAKESSADSEEKPKWYQFVTRFKMWNEKRKQKALPEPSEQKDTETVVENSFKNSLKYDIVKEAVEQKIKEETKQAKLERKQAQAEKNGESR